MTTPTPRTDALDAELGVSDLRIGDAGRYRKLASQLERELAAAQEAHAEQLRAAQAREVVYANSLASMRERAQAAEARVEECERIITAMTQWLDQQQPDVFRRGLWDAIAEGK